MGVCDPKILRAADQPREDTSPNRMFRAGIKWKTFPFTEKSGTKDRPQET